MQFNQKYNFVNLVKASHKWQNKHKLDSDIKPIDTITVQCPIMEKELPNVSNIENDDREVGTNIYIIHTYVIMINSGYAGMNILCINYKLNICSEVNKWLP